MWSREVLEIRTRGRGPHELTERVQEWVARQLGGEGMCSLFLKHTSASLLISENADARVLSDLESWFERAVPDGDPRYEHRCEGPDDMPAHVRSVLTGCSLVLPVEGGRCALGTWQGVYLWEHRYAPHRRLVTLSFWAGPA